MSRHDLVLLLFVALPLVLGVATLAIYRSHARASTKSRARLLLVAANVATLALLLSLVLPVGEVYYRFFVDETDGWDLGLVTERWYRRHYRTNNFGVRDDVDYRLARDPARPRLTILGDSFANGHGMPEVATRFTNIIRRGHPGWDVQLIAADGMDTGEIIARLQALVSRGYELDQVLYAYCLNDISDISEEWHAAAARIGEFHPGWIVRNSFFLDTWYYRYKTLFDPEVNSFFDFILRAYHDATWQEQVRRLEALKHLIEAHGGRLSVVTFPFLETLGSAEYREVHRQLDGLWVRLGVPHLDLEPLFRDIPAKRLRVNRYDSHPNAYANRLAAEAIERFIEENGQIPGNATPARQ